MAHVEAGATPLTPLNTYLAQTSTTGTIPLLSQLNDQRDSLELQHGQGQETQLQGSKPADNKSLLFTVEHDSTAMKVKPAHDKKVSKKSNVADIFINLLAGAAAFFFFFSFLVCCCFCFLS